MRDEETLEKYLGLKRDCRSRNPTLDFSYSHSYKNIKYEIIICTRNKEFFFKADLINPRSTIFTECMGHETISSIYIPYENIEVIPGDILNGNVDILCFGQKLLWGKHSECSFELTKWPSGKITTSFSSFS